MIDRARIAELHGQGLSQGAIAREIGCTRHTVRRHLQRARLARPGRALVPRSKKASENGPDRIGAPSRPKIRANGSAPSARDLAEVERLLAEHFESLSLVERLKFFLKG
jgi:IS30 family transposase